MCSPKRALVVLSALLSMMAFVLRASAKEQFVTVRQDHLASILGLSHEPHTMTSLARLGAPNEYVNDDLEKLEVNTGPCIFVGLQPPPGPEPIYEVFKECFDLAAEKESKSFLYGTDSAGNVVRNGTLAPFGEYRDGDPLFDVAAWKWVMEHVTPRLEQKIAAERARGMNPLPLHKVNPKGEHGEPRVTAPILIHSHDAESSEAGVRAHISGISVVAVVIDTHGVPLYIHTIRPLGYGMDEQAVKAVEQYRFQPSKLGVKPVPVQITIEVNFHQ